MFECISHQLTIHDARLASTYFYFYDTLACISSLVTVDGREPLLVIYKEIDPKEEFGYLYKIIYDSMLKNKLPD